MDVDAQAAGCGAHAFGDASARVVVEDFLDGEEASYIVMSDGTHFVPMATSQDHKRRDESDLGPNTGGMGAYAPLPWLPGDVYREIVSGIVEPVAAEMVQRGSPFCGLLYVGLAITAKGPAVVEFNCRFGDPETQAVLALLDSPLGQLLHAAGTGALAGFEHDDQPLRKGKGRGSDKSSGHGVDRSLAHEHVSLDRKIWPGAMAEPGGTILPAPRGASTLCIDDTELTDVASGIVADEFLEGGVRAPARRRAACATGWRAGRT